MDDSEILARLALIGMGKGAGADTTEYHETLLTAFLEKQVSDPASSVAGRDIAQLRSLVTGDHPVERMLDAMVRTGAYGDGFGDDPDGLSLAQLVAHPHGIDLGPL